MSDAKDPKSDYEAWFLAKFQHIKDVNHAILRESTDHEVRLRVYDTTTEKHLQDFLREKRQNKRQAHLPPK